MPFNRPDLTTLIDRATADIDSRLSGTTWLRRRLVAILARMEAGLAHGLYGLLQWSFKQLFPHLAEAEYLGQWASIWGINRKPATTATGTVIVTGRDGAIIPAGTLIRTGGGVMVMTDKAAQIAEGKAEVTATATVEGAAAITPATTPLTLVSPILGADQTVSLTGDGLTGGAEEEDDDSLRDRLLFRIRNQPAGGAYKDYIAWATAIPGVTRAWVYPNEMGRGTVTVRVMMDGSYPDGIPHDDDLVRVKAEIETKRPVTADVFVVAPVPQVVDMTVTMTPDSPELRQQVDEALHKAILQRGQPGGILIHQQLETALAVVLKKQGVEDYDYHLLNPTANLPLTTGVIPVPGTIRFVDWDEGRGAGGAAAPNQESAAMGSGDK